MVMPEVFRASNKVSGELQSRITNMKHRIVSTISEPRHKAPLLRSPIHKNLCNFSVFFLSITRYANMSTNAENSSAQSVE
jgi:hypothetical protein